MYDEDIPASQSAVPRARHIFRTATVSSTIVDVHLEDFTLILRGRMPKDVVLNEHENSRTYGSGL